MNKEKMKTLLALHLVLMIYSLSSVCSKLAAKTEFLSFKFCFFYASIIALLGLYAVAWQQIIKRLALTTAFANKAVTIVWGIIWGMLFFHETISIRKVIGAIIVIIGVVLYAIADGEEKKEDAS